MTRPWPIAAALTCALFSHPAQACVARKPIVLADIRDADTVVVGRIVRYEVVRDRAFRERMVSNPRLPARQREFYTGDHDLVGDYARIEIEVAETLRGTAARKIAFSWYNSTFGLPKRLPDGPLLIALRTEPDHGLDAMTVVQTPCSGPFMFDRMSDDAQSVRRMLAATPG